jgi:hypothetical protein
VLVVVVVVVPAADRHRSRLTSYLPHQCTSLTRPFTRIPCLTFTQMSDQNREDLVYLAKLAEQAERYEGL